MGRTERNQHTKGRSFPERARGLDRCAVQLDELLHQREADPGAFMRTPVSDFYAMEALEQARQFLLGNTYPCVGHFEQQRGHRFAAIEPDTEPASVNLNAFERRFSTIFSHISRST